MTSWIVLTDSDSFYFTVDFVEVLDHDLVDYLSLSQLLQETHLWTQILRIWQWRGPHSYFRLVPFIVDFGEVLDLIDELKDPTITLMN
jgi:hypothetical protein